MLCGCGKKKGAETSDTVEAPQQRGGSLSQGAADTAAASKDVGINGGGDVAANGISSEASPHAGENNADDGPAPLEATPDEKAEQEVAPPQKPLSAKAASKVCYYLVSHFFGRSMQYKPELLRLSEQVGDFRIISSERLKAFLDASKIMVPKDKMAPIARYYAPPASPRTSEAFVLAQGGRDSPDGSQKAIMMDVDHLLLDLDKAAMRYYLNKNVSEDDTKPAANVDLARVTELVFQMLVEDPAFANREISDEEEIRIEELIASVDLSTVSIPIGTRARVVKANLANTNVGDTSLKRSLRRGSSTLLTALGGVARLPSLAEYLQKNLSKREKSSKPEEPQDSQMTFDVPSWSLRAMQTRQGERNAHLQVQKGAVSLSTPQSQAIQNMLRKRSLIQQQEILAHAVSGAVKAVMLADGKGAEGKDPPPGSSTRWSDNSVPGQAKAALPNTGGSGSFAPGSAQVPAAASKAVTRKSPPIGKPLDKKVANGAPSQSPEVSVRGKPDRPSPTSHTQGPTPAPSFPGSAPHTSTRCTPDLSEIGPASAAPDISWPAGGGGQQRPSTNEGRAVMARMGSSRASSTLPQQKNSSSLAMEDRDRRPSSQGPNPSSYNALRVRKGSGEASPTPL
mmetsp:Transcript_14284/g.38748  ORF Transcript_14284/g.38748 Transcript_14284/m.38748 type:complete len:624 (-) Transcript_14284:741-2612(-)